MNPTARQDQLLVQKIADELVVCDVERNQAHRLNPTAALVWRHCDGQNTIADLAVLLQKEADPQANEDLVWMTLDQLSTRHLLVEPIIRTPEQSRVSRRRAMQKIGTTGVLSLILPVVITLALPTPAQASSGGTYCCCCLELCCCELCCCCA
jgi:hypothetical protein